MYKKQLIFAGLAIEIFIISVIALHFGEELDKTNQTNGIYVVMMLFLGLILWVVHLIFLMKKMEK